MVSQMHLHATHLTVSSIRPTFPLRGLCPRLGSPFHYTLFHCTFRSPPHSTAECTTADTTPAPTALSNGPTIIEAQCDFIAAMISATKEKKIKSVHPTAQAQVEWQGLIDMMNEHTLFPVSPLIAFENLYGRGGLDSSLLV